MTAKMIAPNLVRVELIHLTLTGDTGPDWRGLGGYDGWHVVMTAPSSVHLASEFIGPELPGSSDEVGKARVKRIIRDMAAGLPGRYSFDPDGLVPYEAARTGRGYAAEPSIPRFGQDDTAD